MKYLHSERGYTLIITLLLVVLILLFTATFTVASMNQAKQVERTDESYVALSLAEMGAEKFTINAQGVINNLKQDYIRCLNQESDINVCDFDVNPKLVEYLESEKEDKNSSNDISADAKFYVSDYNFKALSDSNTKLSILVEGLYKNSVKDIEVIFKIDKDNDFELNLADEFVSTSANSLYTPYIKNCAANEECIQNLDDSIYITNNQTNYKNHHNFSNLKQVYILNNVILGQAFKGDQLTELKFYTSETLNFDKKFVAKRSTFEAKKMDLSFNPNDTKIVNSSLFIFNDFHIPLTTSNANSYIKNPKVIVVEDSKICIRKNYDESILKYIFSFDSPGSEFYTLAGTFNSSGNFIYNSSLEKSYKHPGGATLKRVNLNEFNEKCEVTVLDKRNSYQVINLNNVEEINY